MASIVNAKLAIKTDLSTQTSRCVTTCRIIFTSYEVQQIKEGLKFSLNANLWGEDLGNWLNPDDFIFSYATKIFPDATPTAIEDVTFEAVLGNSLLNEDWGTDEVYAQLTLKNLYTGNKVKAKTNVIKREF